MKRSTLGVRRSRVKVKEGRSLIWRPGGTIILDSLGREGWCSSFIFSCVFSVDPYAWLSSYRVQADYSIALRHTQCGCWNTVVPVSDFLIWTTWYLGTLSHGMMRDKRYKRYSTLFSAVGIIVPTL